MTQSNDQQRSGDEKDFTKAQSDLDKAKNERSKEEPNNRREGDEGNLTTKIDTPRKKTGGGKQVNPGM
jgi:hypothetical protein